jgi:hypothetical protein
MNDIITAKGLELDGISSGDIVTVINLRQGDRSHEYDVLRVVSTNSCHAVCETLGGGWRSGGWRSLLKISAFRWFEASEIWEAMKGQDGDESADEKVNA